jgi:hypothetical protein
MKLNSITGYLYQFRCKLACVDEVLSLIQYGTHGSSFPAVMSQKDLFPE